jgi:hypothetical protein
MQCDRLLQVPGREITVIDDWDGAKECLKDLEKSSPFRLIDGPISPDLWHIEGIDVIRLMSRVCTIGVFIGQQGINAADVNGC